MYDELRRSKDEIQYEINNNNRIIETNIDKIGLLRQTTYSQRMYNFLICSVIGIAISAVAVVPLTFSLINNGIEMPQAFLTSWLGCGAVSTVVLENIVAKINKKKVRSVTNAKTKKEIHDEIIKSEIELEKAKCKNASLKKSYEYIDRVQQLGINQNNQSYNKEEELKNNRELVTKIYDTEKRLENETIKVVLHEEYAILRKKPFKIMGGVLYSSLTGILLGLTAALVMTPNLPTYMGPLSVAVGLVAASGTGLVYVGVMKNDRKRFNEINDRLGSDKLSLDEDVNEIGLIENKQEELMQKLSNLYIELQNSKRNLESIAIKEEVISEEGKICTYQKENSLVEEELLISDKENEGKTLVKRI